MTSLFKSSDRWIVDLGRPRPILDICFRPDEIMMALAPEEEGSRSKAEEIKVAIANRFKIKTRTDMGHVDPSHPLNGTGLLLSLIGVDVKSFVILKGGTLIIILGDDTKIEVPPFDYEAWRIFGDGLILIGLPGGGASVSHNP